MEMTTSEFRQAISKALTAEPFDPAALIGSLKVLPGLDELFQAPAGERHGLPLPHTLGDHTLAVMGRFERFFNASLLPSGVKGDVYRITLALHDIGKPLAFEETGETAGQYEFTGQVLLRIRDNLPVEDAEFAIMQALLESDPIGLLFQGKLEIQSACDAIIASASLTALTPDEFLRLLSILYQCDAASYTRAAGYPSDWLLPVFQSHPAPGQEGAEPVFDPVLGRLRFSPQNEELFAGLEAVVKQSCLQPTKQG